MSLRFDEISDSRHRILNPLATADPVTGVGVDISKVFLAAARERAAELPVDHLVTLVEADTARYVVDVATSFHVVSCIGGTWS